jgi:hypothetical protein
MDRRALLLAAPAAGLALAPGGQAKASTRVSRRPPPGPDRPFPGARPVDDWSARRIIERATEAAGGESWRRPRTLFMTGHGTFYGPGPQARVHERHAMWRVYPTWKADAHRADGKVRIESVRDGRMVSFSAFDGVRTYNLDGPMPPSDADRQWSENFGFGIIRHALDDGHVLTRMPDDLVDGRPCHMVEVKGPSGAASLFSIAHDGAQILRVGFATPRGWHERLYSDFFSKPGVDWVQPGRVRLLYNGVKQNEIVWRDFDLNVEMADALFDTPPPR